MKVLGKYIKINYPQNKKIFTNFWINVQILLLLLSKFALAFFLNSKNRYQIYLDNQNVIPNSFHFTKQQKHLNLFFFCYFYFHLTKKSCLTVTLVHGMNIILLRLVPATYVVSPVNCFFFISLCSLVSGLTFLSDFRGLLQTTNLWFWWIKILLSNHFLNFRII